MAQNIQEEPDNDASLPAGPQGQSSDASDSGALKKMWDSWTSHPENNAALINFGLQMMQPRGMGQSAMGHFGQAIGAGAEGMQRNVAAQEEREKYEEAEALKEREESRKEQETQFYGQAVANKGMRKLSPIEMSVLGQKAYNTWAGKAPDIIAGDNIVNMMNQRHPELGGKLTKAQIMANPNLSREVLQYMTPKGDQYTGGILGSGTTMDSGDSGGVGSAQDALIWAKSHPENPKAKAILERLGMGGGGE